MQSIPTHRHLSRGKLRQREDCLPWYGQNFITRQVDIRSHENHATDKALPADNVRKRDLTNHKPYLYQLEKYALSLEESHPQLKRVPPFQRSSDPIRN